ncbi:gamma-glutamyltransferase family protein [Oceanibium sediminis]|uniref:gamma-glutamyltransferase family protein n=1 Tax=Oceanibium sediminis TaxID=2026339 RepID=UPI000DD34F14|nr:gamma-glutamyltransferase family protein [Oceanibium sediminis]
MRDFQQPNRSLVYAGNGMAATSHPLGAKVAIDILQAGGNAVDAAIAGALVLGIAEPQMTGIGGDCFALVCKAGEAPIGLNGSGRAPAGMDADALRAAGHGEIPDHTGHAVTVPGALDGFIRLHADHGALGLDAVLAPTIHYAEEGVPVAPRVAFDWAIAEGRPQGAARHDYLVGGTAPRAGQTFRAPKQAVLLKRVAQVGRSAFYEGPAAAAMVKALNAAGGAHSLQDFADNRPDYVDPIRGSYRGTDLVELPPNGQGATAILLARMLEHFDLSALDPRGIERLHLEAEATKLAYDARNRFIADPEASARYLDHMLAPETADRLAALIDPKRAQSHVAKVSEAVHRDTIYITVVDRDRTAVSLIYSIFSSFGAGLSCPETGVLFQNRGRGFNLIPDHPNEAGPGKRPMHTIIPAMLMQGNELLMPFGVMGGQYQSCGHVRFASNQLDYGMDPQAAIEFPRAFAFENTLSVERGYTDAQRAALADMGHKVVVPETPIGGAQAIRIDSAGGVLIGASDPRKDGCALGY